MNDCYFVINKKFEIVYIGDSFLYGQNENYLVGANILELGHGLKNSIFEAKYKEVFTHKKPLVFYALYPILNHVLEVNVYPNKKEDTVTIYFRDMKINNHLSVPSLLTKCADDIEDMVLIIDVFEINEGQVNISYINNSLSNYLGIPIKQLVGQNFEILGKTKLQKEVLHHIEESLTSKKALRVNLEHDTGNGKKKWVLLEITPIKSSHNGHAYWLVMQKDITQARHKEDIKTSHTLYDQLTGLPNQHAFNFEIEKLLKSPKDNAALLFMNLNNFKNLNNTLGHSSGDLVLKEITVRLKQSFNGVDFVSRFNGDEFVVIVRSLSKNRNIAISQISKKITNLFRLIKQPFHIGETSYIPSIRVGVTFIGKEHVNKDELILEAELAMSNAKGRGVNSFAVFTTSLKEKIRDKHRIEKELTNSFNEHNELLLFFQPQIKHERVVGAEALIRWNNKEKGFMEPFRFMPYVLESGLITNLDFYVMEQGCKTLQKWSNDSLTRELNLSINLTAHTFIKKEFIDRVNDFINKYKFEMNRLKFEITENLFLENNAEILERIDYLKNLGIKISLDDFGTGYSSLSYLRKFPVDEIKLDREFLINALDNRKERIITQTIIEMARKLDILILAEGVETIEQKEFLLENGCFVHQGFLYSKALSEENFINFLVSFNKVS